VVVVALNRTDDTGPVAQALRTRLGAGPFDVWTWQKLNGFYDKAVALYDRQFGVLQLIILAMVVLSVANSINMTVFERLGEFGTMRALGNRSRAVWRIVVLESALVGVAGGALGVVIGIVLALLISAIGIPMPPPPNADLGYTASIRIVPWVVATAFAIGCAASVLAALWPAARVAKRDLSEALRANV
jgi:putative ABC transport system permease protein